MLMTNTFDTLLSIQRALENAYEREFPGNEISARGIYPPINIFENETDVVVQTELPGIDKKEIGLQYQNKTLSISGERKSDFPEDVRMHRRERALGKFSRSIKLPYEIDFSKADARYQDGVLIVRLPKREEEKPKSITIG